MIKKQLATLTDDVTGAVLYADGSFRRNNAGWGVHGYYYTSVAVKPKALDGYHLTDTGYTDKVEEKTPVVPGFFLDGMGCVDGHAQTNNTGELMAMVKALEVLTERPVPKAIIYSDSEYVLKGLAKSVKTWRTNGWNTTSGDKGPIKNQALWQELDTKHQACLAVQLDLQLIWIKGHSNDKGNDSADANAKIGSSGMREQIMQLQPHAEYHKETQASETDPLITKTRMLFNIGAGTVLEPTYYCYSLGTSNNYGHKQTDTKQDKNRKTDLLLGKRISDAFFSVVKLNKADTYLDSLITNHDTVFQRGIIELGVARLDNAYKKDNSARSERLEEKAFERDYGLRGFLTPAEDLITKTLTPPRLALDAVGVFVNMQRHLEEFVNGIEVPHQTRIDLTASWYERVGKSEAQMKTKLKAFVTNNLQSLDVPVDFGGKTVTLKLIFGTDIPVRNALSKLAEHNPKVTLLINHRGNAFSYETIIQTDTGHAIYQSPYRQFVVPLPRG